MPIRISKPPVNIREKLAELERPIGVNGAALMATSTPQEAFSLIGAGRRNLLINGDFKVSQRGDYSSATSASHSTYYLDRWKTDIYAVTATIQRQTVTLPDGTQTYSAKMAATSTVANSYLQLQQHVEVFPYMQGRTVTMSAWVRSNRRVRLRMESSAGSYDSLSVHSGNGGWEYMTQTLTLGTSLSTLKFGVILWNSSGGTTGTATGANITSGDYLEFANYQVEFGKVATPFEYRSYGQELALCQRYYEKSFPDNVTPAKGSTTTSLASGGQPTTTLDWNATFTAGTLATHHRFKVDKRGIATMTFYGTSNDKCIFFDFGTKALIYPGFAIDSITRAGFRSYNDSVGLTNNSSWGVDSFNWVADAEL